MIWNRLKHVHPWSDDNTIFSVSKYAICVRGRVRHDAAHPQGILDIEVLVPFFGKKNRERWITVSIAVDKIKTKAGTKGPLPFPDSVLRGQQKSEDG